MITRYTYQDVVWIDVERPTLEEAEQLAKEFDLGVVVEQEISQVTPKPRVDVYNGFVYVVLHFPAVRDKRGKSDHEVDLIVGKNFLITVHYESVPALQGFAHTFEAALLLRKSKNALSVGHLIFELATQLYQSVGSELDVIEDSVNRIENGIFDGNERRMVKPISMTARELLNHKRLLGNQEEALKVFELAGVKLFGDSFHSAAAAIVALHYRVYNRAQSLMDTLSELRATNDSLLSTRQNEIMKNLTVMSSVILPLGLIAGIFGMNTVNNPIIGGQYDFWTVVGIMAVLGVLAAFYFQHKRWF